MERVKVFIGLLRVKHWIKNGLIFLPIIFNGSLFSIQKLYTVFLGAIIFSICASLVYVINDIRDVEKDRLNTRKKHRPLASGRIRIRSAILVVAVVFVLAIMLGVVVNLSVMSWVYLGIYLAINIVYSFGAKDIPIVDITILTAGFVLRVLFGAEVVGVGVSSWLYLSVLAGALYLGLGKRRGELLSEGTGSRKVNKYYTIEFLDKNMYVSITLLFVFYSLWAVGPGSVHTHNAYLTIPLLIIVFMLYSLTIEKSSSSGDPVEVLTSNRLLLSMAAVFILATILVVYLP